ncbi:MAG: OmpA family protein [Saprospiraceae bacterium]
MTRLPLLCCLLLGLLTSLAAQPGLQTKLDLSAKERATLDGVQSDLNNGKPNDAVKGLTGLLKKNPENVDLLLMRASILELLPQPKLAEAAADYEAALALSPDYAPPAYYYLGLTYHRLGERERAAKNYRNYLGYNLTDARLRPLAEINLRNAENVGPAEPQPLPAAVNSPTDQEYFPSVSVDGLTLVFTRRIKDNEDFYQSVRDSVDAPWQAATPITDLNTLRNEGGQTISADGSMLVFVGCNWDDGLGSCDLYLVKRDAATGRWTKPQNMGAGVNTRYRDTQPCLSADGQLLFFASDRPGGQGGMDLWATANLPDGTWSKPINLGDVLNTNRDDRMPFFHPDGKTLYFNSTGHAGLGGEDIYYSKLDSNSRWQPPVNLGYPVNTPTDDANLYISLDGKTAYFTSSRIAASQQRSFDLYQMELPPAARPDPVTFVRAVVVDAVTGKPLPALAEVRRPGRTQQRRAGADGTFLVTLPAGAAYSLAVEHPGYLFYSDRFELTDAAGIDKPYELRIELQPIGGDELPDKETPIVLRNVLFATASAELLPASRPELERLVKLLTDNPGLVIRIDGHTDNVGSDADNLKLSKNRAAAVRGFLEKAGIAATRLSSEGYGESRPVADNATAEGRRLNRRTEFVRLR